MRVWYILLAPLSGALGVGGVRDIYIYIYVEQVKSVLHLLTLQAVSYRFLRLQSSGVQTQLGQNRQQNTDPVKWSSSRHFHFLDFRKERHRNVWTVGSDFFPVVQTCKVGFSDDIKLLLHAQFANSGNRIERLPSVQNLPGNCVCYIWEEICWPYKASFWCHIFCIFEHLFWQLLGSLRQNLQPFLKIYECHMAYMPLFGPYQPFI